jgi:hypothetical protein
VVPANVVTEAVVMIMLRILGLPVSATKAETPSKEMVTIELSIGPHSICGTRDASNENEREFLVFLLKEFLGEERNRRGISV